ncbi:MAG: CPBP family intramembrane metalloprotease [Clostridiales bacterium]|nr:CPBP family intramembrane metalloprotease [Clostridiales bacterium]
MKHKTKIVITPFLVIILCCIVSVLFNHFIDEWAFIPLALVYWSFILLITKPKWNDLKLMLTPKGNNKRWNVIAYIPCLFCIVAFVWGVQSIEWNPFLVLLSLIFIIINPIAEELFWRKYLFDALECKLWKKVLFTTLLFALCHPLTWGVFSVTIRSTIMVFPLLLMGIIWGITYHKTQSIRHCVIAHAIVDTLNLSIWVFLNLFIPPVV